MTGELTLTGKVLPIGGVKEKLMSAKHAGIELVVLPWENRRDVEELKPYIIEGMDIQYAQQYDDVFNLIFPHYKPNNANATAAEDSSNKQQNTAATSSAEWQPQLQSASLAQAPSSPGPCRMNSGAGRWLFRLELNNDFTVGQQKFEIWWNARRVIGERMKTTHAHHTPAAGPAGCSR